MSEKDDTILIELKRRALEDIKFGTVLVEFKIHEGKIISGEIIQTKVKLG